jgi:antitoxin YefM
MKITTYSDIRANLKRYMDAAEFDHEPVLIKRTTGKDMILIPAEDLNGYVETLFLMSNVHNKKRLMESIEQVEKGEIKTFSIDTLNNLFDEHSI